jgi:hypothetical protein
MALTDYSDLEKEVMDAPQPKMLPKGTEVKVRIIGVNTGTSEKNGVNWFSPRFDVPEDPMVIEFNTFFWDLHSAKNVVDPKQYARNLFSFQQFCKAFGIDLSKPFDLENDLIGRTGYVQVGIQHSDQYGDQNTVSKFVAGPGSRSKSSVPVDDNDIPF